MAWKSGYVFRSPHLDAVKQERDVRVCRALLALALSSYAYRPVTTMSFWRSCWSASVAACANAGYAIANSITAAIACSELARLSVRGKLGANSRSYIVRAFRPNCHLQSGWAGKSPVTICP